LILKSGTASNVSAATGGRNSALIHFTGSVARSDGTAERVIARLASQTHGVVTWSQLLRAGISEDEIRHRLRIGALIRIHRGVYRVGHRAPSVEASYIAAVFACGHGALLCGRAAAYLHGMIRGGPPPPEVIATVKRKLRGVITHRARRIEDATAVKRIPVTTVPRTLVDIAKDLDDEDLGRACHEAGVRYRTTPRDVQQVLARRPNAPGAAKLRRIITGDTPIILSKLEKASFVASVTRAFRFLGRTGSSRKATSIAAGQSTG
jgi:hypothetical protein